MPKRQKQNSDHAHKHNTFTTDNKVISQQTNIGGTLKKVFAQGDLIDGKVISGLFLGSQAIDGRRITFDAIFADGSEGVYVVTAVPESSAVLGTVALGVLGSGVMLKRKLSDTEVR